LFSAEAGYTNNLFYSEDDRFATSYAGTSVGVLAEIPYSRSEGQIGYVLRWLDYRDIDIDQQLTQFFDADTVFRWGAGGFLGVEAEFQDGAFDTRLFDPGGEITFRLEPFTRWSVGLEAGHEIEERQLLGIRIRREELRFDRDPNVRAAFFDTDTTEMRLRGEHARASGLWWIWDLSADRSDLFLPRPLFDDVRRNEALTARVGLRRRLDRRSRFEIVAGWTDRSYDRTDSEKTYGGVIVDMALRRGTPGGIQVDASLSRSVLPSAFLDADFYVSDQLRFGAQNAYEARVILSGAVALFRNRYPDSVTGRNDDLVEARGRIGYRFMSGFVWDLDLSSRYRNSSFIGLDYDEFRIESSIRLGN
jgi:hypothetical protein